MSSRIALYRKIEVARKQLPYLQDEETFRALLVNEFGKDSRKKMSLGELATCIRILVRLGAKFSKVSRSPHHNPIAREDFIEITDSMPFAKEKRQILAIWRKLGYQLPSLNVRVKRAFGVAAFVWLHDADHIRILLNDLQRREKTFERRAGV